MEQRKLTDFPLQTRLAPITGVQAEARTAELVWTTGARVKRYDWERGHFYLEELSLEPAHVRLGRLQAGAPLLNSHNRYDLAGVLGVVESASVAGGEARATVRFSEREDVEPIFRDVKAKILRNVSCGYVTHRIEMLPADDKSEGLPIYRAVDWEPMEISIVPIGADAGAGVRSEQQRKYPCEFIDNQKKDPMEPDKDKALEHVRPSAQELHRVRTIRELCKHNGIERTIEEDLLSRGATVAEARESILAIKASVTGQTPIRSGFTGDHQQIGDLPPEGLRSLMAEALAERFAGIPVTSPAARQLVSMRTLDLARMSLDARGVRTAMLRPTEIATRAMSLSGGDFPLLLADVANKTMGNSYMVHQSGISKVFKRVTVPDFKNRNVVSLSEAPALDLVQPGGEFKSGAMSDTKEAYAAKTYGRILGITRQAIINDDLGGFTVMSAKMGQMAAEFVAGQLTALVNSNPTLSTGNGGAAVFSTTNGNLVTGTGTGAAINVDNIGIGVKKIRLQKGISGNLALGLGPRYLVVPAALEQLAKQYTSSSYTPALSSSINPWSPVIEPIVEPRLDALSTTAWYLFADPGLFACFEEAWLEGYETPYFQVREGWEVDGLEFKIRLDMGCGAIEYRGCFKNAGA